MHGETHDTTDRTTTRRRRGVTLAVAVVAVLLLPVAALAGHRFGDVPSSNVFHDDIAWLADAGVTRGCNPPANTEFCPDRTVTREQMAAFLRRLETEEVFLTPSDVPDDLVATDDLDGLLPIATFLMFDDGTVATQSSRAPVDGTIEVEVGGTGSYLVTLPGYAYSLASSRAVCTANSGGDVAVQVRSLSGRMWVTTFTAETGDPADAGFSCAVYG